MEWILAGAVLAAAAPALAFGAVAALDSTARGRAGEAVPVLLVLGLVSGAAFGAAAAPVGRVATLAAFRIHGALAFLLGPAIGTLAGAPLAVACWRALLDAEPVFPVALAGAACGGLVVGPAWVVYVALKRKGRSGLPAIPVALLLVPLAIPVTFVGLAAYQSVGR